MVNNTSVLLKYSNKNRYKFQWNAEFLRFLGYFVCECLKEDNDSKDLEKYEYSIELDLDEIDQIEIYNSILGLFSGKENEWIDLRNVFEKWNLFQAAVTLQYFSINSEITDRAGNYFKEAVADLNKRFAEHGSGADFRYEYCYARLYCMQKANWACYLCKKPLYYQEDELGSMCMEFSNEFPDNGNIYMLLGMIYENSSRNKMSAVNAFIESKNSIGMKPYVTSVLYKIGKACEGEENLRWLMNDAYENAYNIMPKYRNIYKVAQQYMNMNAITDAIEYFEECLCKLGNRADYMDPLEQEYLFKVNAHLSYLSIHNNDYFSAVEYAGAAKRIKQRIKEEIENQNGFDRLYYEIYSNIGWNVEEIINLELNRMVESNVNQYLGTAYQKMGLDDIAKKILNTVE
ncbi:hypothetical protein [Agathobacter sp.]